MVAKSVCKRASQREEGSRGGGGEGEVAPGGEDRREEGRDANCETRHGVKWKCRESDLFGE